MLHSVPDERRTEKPERKNYPFLTDYLDAVRDWKNTGNTSETERIKAEAIANETFMKAPNRKPSKLNKGQWLQVRTKAFKNWFGDWELMQKNTETIITSSNFKNISEAKEYAQNNFQGKSFKNKDTGEQITVSSNGIKKTLNSKAFNQSSNQAAHIQAISVLNKLLENSVLAETHTDKNSDPSVEEIQRFYGAIKIGADIFRVKTTVKKIKEKGNKYYTYKIQETELLPERPIDYGKGVHEKQSQFPDTDSNSISMANLLKNAVKNNGEKFNTTYSKVVDEKGEPLVVYHGTSADFDSFKGNANYNSLRKNGAIFFHDNPNGADFWSSIGRGGNELYPIGSNIIHVYLNISNPALFNKGEEWYSLSNQ